MLPTQAELASLDIVYLGSPFFEMVGTRDIDLFDLDIGYLGDPFVRNQPFVPIFFVAEIEFRICQIVN